MKARPIAHGVQITARPDVANNFVLDLFNSSNCGLPVNSQRDILVYSLDYVQNITHAYTNC